MSANNIVTRTDGEIRRLGLEVLNDILGITDSIRFLALISREPTDSVEWSQHLFEGETVEGIHHKALRHWQAKKEGKT